MLYLVSTPIGNIEDCTFRAVKVLASCDYLLCEDTRKSSILLRHFQIQKPLKSFHAFNEKRKEEEILEDLREGKEIALLSDGGTPLISDPGERLVKRCIEENLPITALPGPSSLINGLVLSGFAPIPFQFVGFLPKKSGQKERAIKGMLDFSGTSLCFESPFRLLATLKILATLAPQRSLAVLREMTKKFEEAKRGVAKELIDYFSHHTLKGEIVLAISPTPKIPSKKNLLQPINAKPFAILF